MLRFVARWTVRGNIPRRYLLDYVIIITIRINLKKKQRAIIAHNSKIYVKFNTYYFTHMSQTIKFLY